MNTFSRRLAKRRYLFWQEVILWADGLRLLAGKKEALARGDLWGSSVPLAQWYHERTRRLHGG